MHEFEGVCSYPDQVDDDLITSQGLFRQPSFRTSLVVGFVTIMKLFRIHQECLIRHRTYMRLPCSTEVIPQSLAWIREAQERIQVILEELPLPLRESRLVENLQPADQANAEIFGTERANVLITAASVKFAIVSQAQDCLVWIVELGDHEHELNLCSICSV